MNRKQFLQKIVILAGVGIITPQLLKKESSSKGLCFNGVDDKLNMSNFDCFYDFTNAQHAIFDIKGKIIGWKDISGNENHLKGLTTD